MATTLAQRIEVVRDDITRLDVDIIVNAANSSLMGGGGVDGAIHRGRRPRSPGRVSLAGRLPHGPGAATGGHRLRARYVIHAVGPVYQSGQNGEAGLLRSCYQEALRLAEAKQAGSIAFPRAFTLGSTAIPRTRHAASRPMR